jgi:hypothetical protein
VSIQTVENTNSRIDYDGNDVRVDFPTTFAFLAESDLVVQTSDDDGETWTTLTLDDEYSVAGADDPEPGGTVTFGTPPATGTTVRLERSTPITQELEFQTSGPLPAKAVGEELAKLTFICQELARRVAALEALADLVNVTELADAVRIGPTVFTTADPAETTFPFNVACPGGENAEFIVWRVVGDDIFIEGAVVDWDVGVDVITVKGITGLLPNVEYALKGLVFFEP